MDLEGAEFKWLLPVIEGAIFAAAFVAAEILVRLVEGTPEGRGLTFGDAFQFFAYIFGAFVAVVVLGGFGLYVRLKNLQEGGELFPGFDPVATLGRFLAGLAAFVSAAAVIVGTRLLGRGRAGLVAEDGAALLLAAAVYFVCRRVWPGLVRWFVGLAR